MSAINPPLMYDEMPEYKKGFWKTVTSHNLFEIKGFFGDYRFLSNFYPCVVVYGGRLYPSVENAYMAAKVVEESRHYFQHCPPREAKANWFKFPLKEYVHGWDNVKYEVMSQCIRAKFVFSPDLLQKLTDTGSKYLEETNWWKDKYWGVCYKTGEGENNLGKLLMGIREELL